MGGRVGPVRNVGFMAATAVKRAGEGSKAARVVNKVQVQIAQA